MRTTSSSFIKLTLSSLGAILLFAYSIKYLGHVYVSLLLAFSLAYVLDPMVAWLEKRGIHRSLGGLLSLLAGLIVSAAFLVLVLPKIYGQGKELWKRLPQAYARLVSIVEPLSQRFLGYNIFQEFDRFLNGPNPGALAQDLFSTTFKVVTATLGLLIIPLMAYYLLREFPTISKMALYLVPKRYHRMYFKLRQRLHEVLGGFLRGQMLVSLILAIYYAVALSIVRVELALVLGFLAGFLNVIPYVGISSVMVLTFLITVIHGATTGKLIALGAIFAGGIAVEGAILTPRIVGSKVGLSPLVLIVALMIGGEISGLMGMLMSVPAAALGKIYLEILVDAYRGSDFFSKG